MSKHRIKVRNNQEKVPVDRERLQAAARAVIEGEGFADADVTIALLDDATIHALNKRFLDHDEPTDVLSFPSGEGTAKKLSGELAVGADVAQRQATERGHDVQAELALYVIHGLLHLCGYDDHEDAGRAAMRQRERHYLQLLGFPDVAPREDE